MKEQEKKQARELRENGMSLREISKVVNASKSTISLWVSDIELSKKQYKVLKDRQKASQGIASLVAKENYKRKREFYQCDGMKHAKNYNPLHIMGCMLYWGEGAKTRNSCKLGNTDVSLLKMFVRFLKECFDVKDSEINITIQAYLNNGISEDEIKKYWMSALKVNPRKISLYKLDGKRKTSGKRKNVHKYGVCSIGVNKTSIVQSIYGSIQEYIQEEKPDWIM